MLQIVDRAGFVGRRAVLVFRTTHIDKAGETRSTRRVDAEIVELDASGAAILVSDDGVHLRFPAAMLRAHGGSSAYVGGQELVRNFHDAVEPVTLRWLTGDALDRELTKG